MISFAIFAVTFVVGILFITFYLYPGSRSRPTTIPGPDPSDPKEGNMPDIYHAGGFADYLVKVHGEYGQIVNFWMGSQLVVSISAPEYFKEIMNSFDRPSLIFEYLMPIIGQESLQFQNGAEGRKRRQLYDGSFSHEACRKYSEDIVKLSEDLAKKWLSLPSGQHIPLHQYMMAFGVKGIVCTNFGEYFKDDKKILGFVQQYDLCMSELQARVGGPVTDKNDPREKCFQDSMKHLNSTIRNVIVQQRKAGLKSADSMTFINCLLDCQESEDVIVSDAITYMIGGFHTTGNFLTWAIYYMAENPEIQEKVYEELMMVFGDGPFEFSRMNELKYTRQLLDETLRYGNIAPYAARTFDHEIVIGGHVIPKNTPIIQAMGVSFADERYWPNPEKFDPDRFSDEGRKNFPAIAFQPFGFAGKRKCPGYRFSYMEATIFLAMVVRKLHIKLVEGQVVVPKLGIVTKPEDEIWITVKERK